MTKLKAKQDLHPDVWDALEFSALVYGGVGRRELFAPSSEVPSAPCCLLGHAICVQDGGSTTAADAVINAGKNTPNAAITVENDAAVARINKRLGRHENTRVGFQQLMKELGIVRGDSSLQGSGADVEGSVVAPVAV